MLSAKLTNRDFDSSFAAGLPSFWTWLPTLTGISEELNFKTEDETTKGGTKLCLVN
jgi:hypothetical protein